MAGLQVPLPRRSCAVSRCKSSRVDLGCSRSMCRKHCNDTGPCALRAHESNRRNKLSAPSAPAAPPAVPQRRPSGRIELSPSEADWHARGPVSLNLFQAHQTEQDLRKALLENHLDNLAGVHTPPEEGSYTEQYRRRYASQLEEEQEIQHAIDLSLLDDHPASRNGTASRRHSPPPQAGPSQLRVLSPSPDFPLNLAGTLSSNQAHGERPSGLKITTQLNGDWMNTQGGPSVRGARLPSTTATGTFHVKKKGSQTTRRFIVVYWNDVSISYSDLRHQPPR
ncbi:hypothetical protein R3P38DRAFT_2637118 [Favolaschia claudopus]|uniref:Uncharacterized protein n=1 Tax=Favolaschia claudopus TaxID=2862362 RepID=A0AAW0ARP3_9AGAR